MDILLKIIFGLLATKSCKIAFFNFQMMRCGDLLFYFFEFKDTIKTACSYFVDFKSNITCVCTHNSFESPAALIQTRAFANKLPLLLKTTF